MTGVDESEAALALARENAAYLGLDVDLRIGGLEAAQDSWALVVSNPPYVDTLDGLPRPELRFEPEIALVGSGLHERLAEGEPEPRALVLEVGAGRGKAERVAAALKRSRTAETSGLRQI